MAFAIACAAIVMFVAIGGKVLPRVLASMEGIGIGPDRLLATALLLNIALVIFGWRRYRELHDEIRTRREAEQQARRLAETDPLTGCLNRRSLAAAADRLIAEAGARGNLAVAIMIDIDNFKQLNDFHGHAVGDRVLRECARRIGELLPPAALLARLGGDEFACVLVFDPVHSADVDCLAEKIIARIAAPVELEDVHGKDVDGEVGSGDFGILVSASVGLARSDRNPADGTSENAKPADAAALFHMADLAMYQAKKAGRNRYAWFEAAMLTELRQRGELEAGIRKGIAAGEFVPYYEQQIDLASGELCGFEMLARWHSPELGLVNPEVFIPVAEGMGAIGELSERLIAQALRDAKSWAPHLTLAVNVSPIQLRDPWFAQKLLKLLVSEGLSPNRLDIEITETCLHENLGAVQALVASLKNQGVRISLDDFGTGYSSLAQLRALPFDRIKIDRSFVTSMPECSDSDTIVRTISSLGEGLGLPITAEGIENEEVLQKLRTLGNLKGQGYLYGRPQPAEEVRDMLARRGLLAEPAGKTPAEPDSQAEIASKASA